LSTHGRGGAGGNARGITHYQGELVAAVNNGSNTVALFRRDGDTLRFANTVTTTSAPVSVDFGNDHMYVAGATTVDSFVLEGRTVAWLDGTAGLEVAGGGTPPIGQHRWTEHQPLDRDGKSRLRRQPNGRNHHHWRRAGGHRRGRGGAGGHRSRRRPVSPVAVLVQPVR
jgi:hypothetical protein